MNRLLVISCLLAFSTGSFSQSVDVRIAKENYLIGEEMKIEYEVRSSASVSDLEFNTTEITTILFPTGSTTNGTEVELEELKAPFDTSYRDQNERVWKMTWYVTIYDSGLVQLSNHSVKLNDSVIYFPDLRFRVDLTAPLDSVDIYDINEQFANVPDEPFSIGRFLSNWWWRLLVILGAVLGYLVFRKRKSVYNPPDHRTSLKERTLKAIDALEDARLWEKEQMKDHFVELSFILRSYLASRYGINLLERTTNETRILLKEKGLNDDTITTIFRILSQSDLVKFARSKPDMVDILKTVTLCRQIVAETSPLEIEEIDD